MSTAANELEVLIDDYVEGRLEGSRREQFEARMKADAELRRKVQTATQSIEIVRQVLAIDPADDFEDKVSSQIINITQSNPGMRPFQPLGSGNLTADDPDAKLFHDPKADRERARLMFLAAAAAILFAAAAVLMVLAFTNRENSGNRPPIHGK